MRLRAGSPRSRGTLDGVGAAARFQHITDLAVGPDGVVFVAEGREGGLRRLDRATGAVTSVVAPDLHAYRFVFVPPNRLYMTDSSSATHTLVAFDIETGASTVVAGRVDEPGDTDGLGRDARFDEPVGVTFDGDHTLYVLESRGRIRAFDLESGRVRTVAPQGFERWARDITFAGGALYVLNRELRRVDIETGAFEILVDTRNPASDGVGPAASLWNNNSRSLVADPSGTTLWIADHRAVRRYEIASRRLSTVVGSLDAPAGDDHRAELSAVALTEDGTLLMGDGAAVRSLDLETGEVSTLAGMLHEGPRDGAALDARFFGATHVSVDGVGNVFVGGADRLRRLSPLDVVTTYSSTRGWVGPSAADDAGNVYFADIEEWPLIVQLRVEDGTWEVVAGALSSPPGIDGEAGVGTFQHPRGFTFDPDTDTLYLLDADARVRALDTETFAVRTLVPRRPDDEPPGLPSWSGIALDRERRRIFTGESGVVRELDLLTGEQRVLAGDPTQREPRLGDPSTSVAVDGVGESARFHQARGVAFDPRTRALYVADRMTVRRIDVETREVRTVVGQWGEAGVRTGSICSARLNEPVGVALSPEGDLIVLDSNAVLVVSPAP